jgi:hypothetical protein
MVDITNSDADPRALQRAQNAAAQRTRRVDHVKAEEEIDQRCARLTIPGLIERESAQQAVARLEPSVRERESAQRAVARLKPGVQERESAQRAVARVEPSD